LSKLLIFAKNLCLQKYSTIPVKFFKTFQNHSGSPKFKSEIFFSIPNSNVSLPLHLFLIFFLLIYLVFFIPYHRRRYYLTISIGWLISTWWRLRIVFHIIYWRIILQLRSSFIYLSINIHTIATWKWFLVSFLMGLVFYWGGDGFWGCFGLFF